jgi:hypothetical protein
MTEFCEVQPQVPDVCDPQYTPSKERSNQSFGPHHNFTSHQPGKICFYALSDFGNVTSELRDTAAAMNRYAQQHGSPDFIAGLGDNFYPYGVYSENDRQFDTVWRNLFLKPYPALQVPWRMVLGNHDYYGNPQAQIAYHYLKTRNTDGLWYMPGSYYSFTVDSKKESTAEGEEAVCVDFFAMDTNAVEVDISINQPDSISQLVQQIRKLDNSLQASTADWKIAFAHHPLFTAGWGHGRAGRRLRSRESTQFCGQIFPGFELEDVLVRNQLDAFYAGHEHVFQAHNSHGVQHYCCGASGAEVRDGNGLYRGKDDTETLDWVARPEEYGFVCVELTATQMITKFIQYDGSIIREFTKTK